MRKSIGALLLVLLFLGALPAAAYAASDWGWGGIEGGGAFADANRPYGFMPEDVQITENGEISWQWLDELYTGSAVYIPIGKENDSYDVVQATEKDIKNDKVALSWKATMGGAYIRDVTIVDGKKEKIADLPTGAYAKIQLEDSLAREDSVKGQVKLVLSINNVSYRETEVQVDFTMGNRVQYINANTVYGAAVPTLFEVERGYTGEATFDMGSGVRFTARVQPQQRYLINYTTQPEDYVLEEAEARWPGAKLEYRLFGGTAFPEAGRLEIPVDPQKYSATGGVPDVYLYDLTGQMQAFSYDPAGKKLVVATRTLGNYVLSDTDLRLAEAAAPGSAGYEEPASEAGGVTAVPAQPNLPPTGGDEPAAEAPAPAPELPLTNLSTNINTENKAGDNPLTGLPAVPVWLAALGALGAGAALWRFRPAKKK